MIIFANASVISSHICRGEETFNEGPAIPLSLLQLVQNRNVTQHIYNDLSLLTFVVPFFQAFSNYF